MKVLVAGLIGIGLGILASVAIVRAKKPDEQIYELKTGWNLIGYNHTEEKNVVDVFVGVETTFYDVYAFHPETVPPSWTQYNPSEGVNTMYVVVPGMGYWVYVPNDVNWKLEDGKFMEV